MCIKNRYTPHENNNQAGRQHCNKHIFFDIFTLNDNVAVLGSDWISIRITTIGSEGYTAGVKHNVSQPHVLKEMKMLETLERPYGLLAVVTGDAHKWVSLLTLWELGLINSSCHLKFPQNLHAWNVIVSVWYTCFRRNRCLVDVIG